MTKDKIIEMAKQAEMIQMTIGEWWGVELSDIENFARLVAEKEREACANICETLELPDWPDKVRQPLAQAIRARSKHD
jgi:hypothetical protein